MEWPNLCFMTIVFWFPVLMPYPPPICVFSAPTIANPCNVVSMPQQLQFRPQLPVTDFLNLRLNMSSHPTPKSLCTQWPWWNRLQLPGL
ncbi:hypothetical protein KC19_VG175000 [Ceratodon purpureus]|uniref:Secreted protein n=1 Tax=Ceratodon purpureus TaxID=3225 RepID=A0A8T0HRN6_CERPU|nr:hypothetical protein KC19_VG175000 [Ceratodon purpureus]